MRRKCLINWAIEILSRLLSQHHHIYCCVHKKYNFQDSFSKWKAWKLWKINKTVGLLFLFLVYPHLQLPKSRQTFASKNKKWLYSVWPALLLTAPLPITKRRTDMYFVVLFLETFHSGVCKNNVGVLLVWSWSFMSVNTWSCRAPHCFFASCCGHWTQIYLFFFKPEYHQLSIKAWFSTTNICRSLCTGSSSSYDQVLWGMMIFPQEITRVYAIVSTFNYVYLASNQSLWFFNTCFAQTFSASLTKTNFSPTFRLLCNFE